MSLLFGEEVVLFSPMEGKITFHGREAAQAKITRVVKWKDEVGDSEIFYANENGEFVLPLKKTRVRIHPLAEFVISQSIYVNFEGKDVQVWGRSKRGIELYDELGGAPQNFRCELTDEVEYIDVDDGLFGTLCKWDLISK